MTNRLSVVLGTLLTRTIVVGAVLVTMSVLWEGAFVMGAGLLLALGMFVHLLIADPVWLR